MQDEFGVIIAGGQGRLSGKIVRIAHLGWMDKLDVIGVICAFEMSMFQLGYELILGEAARAVEEVFVERKY